MHYSIIAEIVLSIYMGFMSRYLYRKNRMFFAILFAFIAGIAIGIIICLLIDIM